MNHPALNAMTSNYPASQRGAVLIVSLLILLILTVIGVSSMQSSTLEEKMASNSRDRNIGFQSAETAMREAETYIESLVTTGGFTNANGLYAEIADEPDPYAVATWTTSGSTRTATPPGGSAAAQYFITLAGTITDPGAMDLPPAARGHHHLPHHCTGPRRNRRRRRGHTAELLRTEDVTCSAAVSS